MLKVGTQNQAKTLKVSTWPDGTKTLIVPGRSETVPRPYADFGVRLPGPVGRDSDLVSLSVGALRAFLTLTAF